MAWKLLARIHELRPGTPTLLITGHGEHDLAIQALRGGAYDYILKPIDRDYFVVALRRALQTQVLQRQVVEQQHTVELHSKLLEGLVQHQTHELFRGACRKGEDHQRGLARAANFTDSPEGNGAIAFASN